MFQSANGRLFAINKQLFAAVYRLFMTDWAGSHLQQQRSKSRRQRESFVRSVDDPRITFNRVRRSTVAIIHNGDGDGDGSGGGIAEITLLN